MTEEGEMIRYCVDRYLLVIYLYLYEDRIMHVIAQKGQPPQVDGRLR
jgi:hypothetical protein